MVTRRVKVFVDDLDGLPADETVWFGFDGRAFEVDLSAEHAKAFRDALKVYAKAGRSSRRTKFARK